MQGVEGCFVMSFADEKILLFDGACGTNLQEMPIPASA
jgi:methionine synthase I (cobalamin-dependent)